jgi:phenylalanyl-tRNA synthetase alpha chain
MKGVSKEILQQLKERCLKEIESSNSIDDLENIKIKYFGRKGEIKLLFEELKKMPSEERKEVGAILNEINKELRLLLENKIEKLKENSVEYQKYSILEKSLPGVSLPLGNIHPLQKIYNEIIEIFLYLGFSVEEGPEIEFEDYNFTMLNIPYDHPARDMQDTLYLDLPVSDKGKILLRTHTSPVQIRVMLSKKPPIKSIMPGRVYRHENLDASHLFNFHQVEGLAVDKGIRISDLKGVLTFFARLMFGKDVLIRFRPSYFPFTEPSLEMDIQCLVCKGRGCSVCKNTGFVEILGCGMVHPQVLYNVGLGYEDYTGFAFGLGVERVAMLKYRIDDIRVFYTNDLRFLRQF